MKRFQILTLVEYYKKYGGVIATKNEATAKILSQQLTECKKITEEVTDDIIHDRPVEYFINLNNLAIDDNVLKCRLIFFK